MLSNSVFSIAICDDTPSDRELVCAWTNELLKARDISCEIRQYDCGTSLLEALQEGTQFHLLFLDVMMNEMDGIELAATLRSQGNRTAIVFISSNREMAMHGYEVSAVRYLAKPMNREKFSEALYLCHQNYIGCQEIVLPTAKGLRRVSPMDIVYVEAGERGVHVILENEQIDATMRLFEMEALLPARQFVLCHRAFLVNFSHIRYIRRYELELKDDSLIPVSKHRYSETQAKFMNYLKS